MQSTGEQFKCSWSSSCDLDLWHSVGSLHVLPATMSLPHPQMPQGLWFPPTRGSKLIGHCEVPSSVSVHDTVGGADVCGDEETNVLRVYGV